MFARVEKTTLTTDHAERAIWRLAYRKGWNLNFKEILANTMLDEPTALNALKSLEQKQQVKLEPDGTWTLLKTT